MGEREHAPVGEEEEEDTNTSLLAEPEYDEDTRAEIRPDVLAVHDVVIADAVTVPPRRDAALAEPPSEGSYLDGSATHAGDLAMVESVEADLSPLTFEQRYERLGALGKGGMGEVALYKDHRIGRRVALKVMNPEQWVDPTARARFLREARVQGQLEHPAIVPVHDLGRDEEGRAWFTMKEVRGESLEEILEDLRSGDPDVHARYSTRRLLTAFSQVCLAVDLAHRRGVLHRDIKPANIMLGDFGEVYVLDWGLSRVTDASRLSQELPVELPGATVPRTIMGILLGTPGYMSPEQLRGQHRTLGPPSDVYSLGAILFEIATLSELHPRASTEDIYRTTLNGVESRPSVRCPERRVPSALEAIIVRAVALEASDRFQTARQLHVAIETYLDGERDETLRRDLAEQHVKNAATIRAEGSTSVESYRRALREIGRAIALDPDNDKATATLLALLSEPPRELPTEVQHELAAEHDRRARGTAYAAAAAYGSMLVYLPLLMWMGVRSWSAILTFVALSLVSVILCFVVARFSPKQSGILIVALVSTALMAATTPLFGGLLVTPMLIAVNTGAYTLQLTGLYRIVAVMLGVSALVFSVAVSLAGMVPGGYAFGPEGMIILPGAATLEPVPTVIFLIASSVGAIILPAVFGSRLRDLLGQTETRLYMWNWNLRQLFGPRERRPPTGRLRRPKPPRP